MTRVIAINFLLIFAPFLLYSAYILLEKKPADQKEFWAHVPLKVLLVIGFFLMSIFYFTQITFNSGIKDGVYHPPQVKDGKVIPGYIAPKQQDKKRPSPKSKTPAQKSSNHQEQQI